MSNDHQGYPLRDEPSADSAEAPTQPIAADGGGPPEGGAFRATVDETRIDDPAGSRADGVVAPPAERSGPRTTTIVWGLIVIAVGAGLLARTAGAGIDLGLAAIVLLAASGVLLVVGSVATSARRRRTSS